MKNPIRDKMLSYPSAYEDHCQKELKISKARAEDLSHDLYQTARRRLIRQIKREQEGN